MLILKIITFPIRFMLFSVLGLLSLSLLLVQNTIILFLNLVASLIAIAGGLMSGLCMIGIIIGIIFTLQEGWNEFKSMIWSFLGCIFLVGLLAISSSYMPMIAAKLYSIVFAAAIWLWGLAKVTLFCDTDRFYI